MRLIEYDPLYCDTIIERFEKLTGKSAVLIATGQTSEEVTEDRLAHLDETERRAYVLADNQLALQAGWDKELLAIELGGLIELNFDLSVIGFEASEVEIILGEAAEADPQTADEEEDVVPPLDAVAVTRPGDIWLLGAHRLICGDARSAQVYDALLGNEEVGLVFTDPPYNVPIARNVSGRGEVRHGDFAMAAGEMNREEFTQFLEAALGAAASRCRDGAIAYVCMDWRHMMELSQRSPPGVSRSVRTPISCVCGFALNASLARSSLSSSTNRNNGRESPSV